MAKFLKKLFSKETEAEKERRLFMKEWSPYNKLDRINYDNYCNLVEGEVYTVTQALTCQGSIHEWNKYPRPGLKIEKLVPGDKVVFVKEYINGYGRYYDLKSMTTGYIYSVNWHDASFALVEDLDSLKITLRNMCKEFDEKDGKVTIEHSLRPKDVQYFVECTKDVSKLGMWIFFPCDTCAKHANEAGEVWLHASLVKKTDMEGLI